MELTFQIKRQEKKSFKHCLIQLFVQVHLQLHSSKESMVLKINSLESLISLKAY